MLRHLTVVRTNVSEERIVSILRVTRIGVLGSTLRRNATVVLTRATGVTSQETAFIDHKFVLQKQNVDDKLYKNVVIRLIARFHGFRPDF
jgi:hypothetical protein